MNNLINKKNLLLDLDGTVYQDLESVFGQVSKLIGGRILFIGITLDQVMMILMPQRKYGAFSKSLFRIVILLPN